MSHAYRLYMVKYRKVWVIMMPYKTMLRTTPTKMGPYLTHIWVSYAEHRLFAHVRTFLRLETEAWYRLSLEEGWYRSSQEVPGVREVR